MKKIDHYEYEKNCHHHNASINRALSEARRCRDREINLFWSRSSYYWIITAGIIAGIATIDESQFEIILILICIGILTSLTWALTNMASKAWQENWEAHVDLLEEIKVQRTLFVTAKYSVSKLNGTISWFIFIAFILLLMSRLRGANLSIIDIGAEFNAEAAPIVIATIIAGLAILIKCRSSNEKLKQYKGTKRDVSFPPHS